MDKNKIIVIYFIPTNVKVKKSLIFKVDPG